MIDLDIPMYWFTKARCTLGPARCLLRGSKTEQLTPNTGLPYLVIMPKEFASSSLHLQVVGRTQGCQMNSPDDSSALLLLPFAGVTPNLAPTWNTSPPSTSYYDKHFLSLIPCRRKHWENCTIYISFLLNDSLKLEHMSRTDNKLWRFHIGQMTNYIRNPDHVIIWQLTKVPYKHCSKTRHWHDKGFKLPWTQ